MQQKMKDKKILRDLNFLMPVVLQASLLSYCSQCSNVQLVFGCHEPVPIKLKLSVYNL